MLVNHIRNPHRSPRESQPEAAGISGKLKRYWWRRKGAGMTLWQRLDRLEGKRNGSDDGPAVIFLCEAETGEPRVALVKGGGTIARGAGEAAEVFQERASAGVSIAVYLPENGRDALATGKTPDWAQGELVMRHLRDKHGPLTEKRNKHDVWGG